MKEKASAPAANGASRSPNAAAQHVGENGALTLSASRDRRLILDTNLGGPLLYSVHNGLTLGQLKGAPRARGGGGKPGRWVAARRTRRAAAAAVPSPGGGGGGGRRLALAGRRRRGSCQPPHRPALPAPLRCHHAPHALIAGPCAPRHPNHARRAQASCWRCSRAGSAAPSWRPPTASRSSWRC